MSISAKKIGVLLALSLLASGCVKKQITTPVYVVTAGASAERENALRKDFETNAGNKIYFKFNSFVLSKENETQLKKQAAWLLIYPNLNATIQGHSDEQGNSSYNLHLGLKRAEAVRNFLIKQGVNPERLSAVSYGRDKPEVLGFSARAQNHNRVVVTVINF